MTRWRRAEPGEDDAIVAMCLALNQEDSGQEPIAPEQVRRTLRVLRAQPTRGLAVVLEVEAREQNSEARIVGYALLIAYWSNEIGGDVCCIDEIYVSPEARGRGQASALIRALARGEGPWPHEAVALTLEVTPDNARALALYERLGFRGKNRLLRLRVS